MTRVLHVVSSIDPRHGGPTGAFVGLVKAQATIGTTVSALATFQAGDDSLTADAMSAAGVSVRLVGPTRGPLRTHHELSAAVKDAVAAADVVHVHAVWEQVQHLACAEAARQGKPFVIRPAGMLTEWSLARSRLRKWVYLRWRMAGHLRRAAAVHFTSEIEARTSLPVEPPSRAIVEPNGVDLTEFETLPPRGWCRSQWPQIGGRKTIAFMGRVFPGKGLEYLVPAVAKLVERGVDPALVIIGPGGDAGFRAAIDASVRNLGLTDRVVFTGMLAGADRIAALADADLFALPSDHENFGIAVVEALAAGLPAIVSPDVGVAPDVVAAGVGSAGPRDVVRLADELSAWLEDHARREATAARARAFVRERYDWQAIAGRWRGHYARLQREA